MLNKTHCTLRASVLLVISVALLLSGCQLDNLAPNGVFQREQKITIEATYEMPEMDTKTVRDDNAKIYWTPGDAISLFFGSGTDGGSKFVAQNDAVALKTAFSGSITAVTGGSDIDDEDTYFWGLYPYDATSSCDGSSVTMSIPAVQPGMEGTFAPGMAPSLGRSQKLVLSFRNIWSGFGFTVSEQGFQSVTFRGNGGENIAGKARIGIDENNLPKVLEILEGVQEVTLTAPDDAGFVPGQYYYMQFFPCTFESGFTVELKSATQRGTYYYTKSMEYPRSTWKRAANVDTRVEEWRDRVVPEEGGTVDLVFFTDKASHVDIPLEAQSWISYVTTSSESNKQTITLAIQANSGAERSATVLVQSDDGTFSQQFIIEQSPCHVYQLAIEREALIAIYNALDGNNWEHNDNWCSDKPIGEWYGVGTDYDGVVVSLSLYGEGVYGDMPNEISSLKSLERLSLEQTRITAFNISENLSINVLIARNNWCLALSNFIPILSHISSVEEIRITQDNDKYERTKFYEIPSIIPEEIYNLINLKHLELVGCNLKGTISPLIGNLKQLRFLCLYNYYESFMEGSIPSEIGYLHDLQYLQLFNLPLTGGIPDEIYTLTNLEQLIIDNCYLGGEISPQIANLVKLWFLNLRSDNLTGSLPSELSILLDKELVDILLICNQLSGNIPTSITSHPKWEGMWGNVVDFNQFDLVDQDIPAPSSFSLVDVYGNILSSEYYYSNSKKYLLIYDYDVTIPFYSMATIPCSYIKEIYEQYNNEIDIIMVDGYGYSGAEGKNEAIRRFMDDNGIQWPCVYMCEEGNNICGRNQYPGGAIPSVALIDCETRQMVWTSKLHINRQDFIDCINGLFDNHLYTSEDYSDDGVVVTVQLAPSNDVLNVVFMGDGFSDRQIADGSYSNVMLRAIDALFSEEPYKTYKGLFNIYYVNVVSANEGYQFNGSTALSGGFGAGTEVYGNDYMVIEYAKQAVPNERLDDALIIVMMNKDAYAGTCYMYDPVASGDYGHGLSIAYFPTSSDTNTFNGLVSHEAGGHGFAKLADEYAYEYMGAISQETINAAHTQEAWGWWKNVDFTNYPTQVKWSPFLSDNRYANEGLGCYEGGFTYWTGVWRPTENSIMRYNTGGFNAPSRYAIWYRINKLAYGDDWNGTYEDFVAYDAVNRTSAATAQPGRNYVLKQLPPLAPPVVVGHSWRDAK